MRTMEQAVWFYVLNNLVCKLPSIAKANDEQLDSNGPV